MLGSKYTSDSISTGIPCSGVAMQLANAGGKDSSYLTNRTLHRPCENHTLARAPLYVSKTRDHRDSGGAVPQIATRSGLSSKYSLLGHSCDSSRIPIEDKQFSMVDLTLSMSLTSAGSRAICAMLHPRIAVATSERRILPGCRTRGLT